MLLLQASIWLLEFLLTSLLVMVVFCATDSVRARPHRIIYLYSLNLMYNLKDFLPCKEQRRRHYDSDASFLKFSAACRFAERLLPTCL